jgi:predicted nuclease of restriction endonuclease-like (RecB) superfamily
MGISISILDKDYIQWVKELSSRYRQSQIKASVKVNQEMLRFYWSLGRDIVEMHIEDRWGEKVIKSLSSDLTCLIPDAHCFSKTNLYYTKKFYLLYYKQFAIVQQAVGQIEDKTKEELVQQTVGHLETDIFSIPWGHHTLLIDKCSDNPPKALFFIRKTMENGWSRSMLLNFLSTDLYDREGKAMTNFKRTLPDVTSYLAQEITKDPYDFAFTGITERYNERKLKDALLANITQFLIELGTGFAYVGKEYQLKIGEKEKFIDLLFYNLTLSCYVVIEVKIGEFDFADAGQLGGYVVACNHLLRKEGRDNPTIGLLVCKQKDNLLAQYALESSSQPLGISEYELAKLYPTKVEGTIPTIEEIEEKLSENDDNDSIK